MPVLMSCYRSSSQNPSVARSSCSCSTLLSGQMRMRLSDLTRWCSYMFPDGISDLVEQAVESSLPPHARAQGRLLSLGIPCRIGISSGLIPSLDPRSALPCDHAVPIVAPCLY